MLKFNNRGKMPLHKLPFIGGKSKSGLGISFWNVPSTGGYKGGCVTGTALAWLWLKHLEKEAKAGNGNTPFTMSHIVNEIHEFKGNDAVRGQVVGFFEIIEVVLFKLISDSKIHFTKEERELLAQANAGLKCISEESNDDIH